jgi:hypothetical protein
MMIIHTDIGSYVGVYLLLPNIQLGMHRIAPQVVILYDQS